MPRVYQDRQRYVARLVELYTVQHLTLAEIGRLNGITKTAVWKILQKAGVKREQGELVSIVCAQCYQPGRMFRSRWRKSKKQFCSPECHIAHVQNPENRPGRGVRHLARQVVAKFFALEDSHVIHYHDSNCNNNRRENLAVFASVEERTNYQRGGRARPIWDGRFCGGPLNKSNL